MGSIVNGISLHSGMLKPYGSTFLIFSDYMRPAVAASALSRLQSLWVWTHDSVGLGEDGRRISRSSTTRAARDPIPWFVRRPTQPRPSVRGRSPSSARTARSRSP